MYLSTIVINHEHLNFKLLFVFNFQLQSKEFADFFYRKQMTLMKFRNKNIYIVFECLTHTHTTVELSRAFMGKILLLK